VVVFNAGAAHHVGPNRLHVELARNLAAMGLPCLRFDLESLGDSVNRRPARENYPYPHGAVADGRAALEFLRERFGYGRFIVLGLCSGAHTVFHLALEADDLPIDQVVMVNPMQFYWVEGMSLDTSRKFEDMVQYRRSMRDPRRWLKLARGDVDVRRLVEVVASQARTHARAWIDALAEAAFPRAAPRLSKDLRRLFAMRRRIALFVSEGDPGRDILMAGAKLTATRALRDGRMRLQMIPGADHTFSQWQPRRDVIGRLLAHLREAASSYNGKGAL
jgi:pimeloyl-ACP methyl ester carboxylesterase